MECGIECGLCSKVYFFEYLYQVLYYFGKLNFLRVLIICYQKVRLWSAEWSAEIVPKKYFMGIFVNC